MRHLAIAPHDAKAPPVVLPLPDGVSSALVVEGFQRELLNRGRATGCSWQVVEGDVISALVAAVRLRRSVASV